jgi:hypothetical protein
VIRKRGGSLQVQVFAGRDPLTGRKRRLSRQVRGHPKESQRQAKKVEAMLLEAGRPRATPRQPYQDGRQTGRALAGVAPTSAAPWRGTPCARRAAHQALALATQRVPGAAQRRRGPGRAWPARPGRGAALKGLGCRVVDDGRVGGWLLGGRGSGDATVPRRPAAQRERDRLQARRLRAAELFAAGVRQVEVARQLEVSAQAVSVRRPAREPARPAAAAG